MPQAPNRIRLTKRIIDHATFEGRHAKAHDVRWDAVVPGLGLRVYPSGRKSYVLRYRDLGGVNRRITLGEHGRLTLDQARSAAQRELGKVHHGRDLLEERREQRNAATFSQLCEAYADRHLPRRKGRRDDERMMKRLRDEFGWGPRVLTTIKRSEVATIHHEIGITAPYAANRYLAMISKMWSCAIEWGLVPEACPNPARGVSKFREEKRDRWVTEAEAPRLLAAIEAHPNIYIRSALMLYLLTGCRKAELLSSRWDHVDFEREELRIPAPKQRRPHRVPLSAPALEILRALPRIEGNPFVLPGARPGSPLVNIDKAWQAIRKDAGLDDVRLHDLRRTVGSWLATAGNSLVLIAKVLGHRTLSTTQVYARIGETAPRQALLRHGQQVMAAASTNQEAQVVPLNRSADSQRERLVPDSPLIDESASG